MSISKFNLVACLLKDLGINGSVDSIGGSSGNISLSRRFHNSSLWCSHIHFEYFSRRAITEKLAKPRKLGCSDLDTLPSESEKALEHWSE